MAAFGWHEDLDVLGTTGFDVGRRRSVEGDDHLVDRRRADTEVALDVGFGGWASTCTGVGMDEGQDDLPVKRAP